MKMENKGWREMMEGIRSEEGERDGIKGMIIRKGAWTEEEDKMLVDHIQKHGHGSWKALPKLAGLNRCGKSCRLRWTNYLRPHLKRGNFSPNEQHTILTLHALLGNRWSTIASHLPGRTDNEIKNFWHTYLKKKLVKMGIDPVTHTPTSHHHHLHSIIYLSNLLHYSHSININAAASNFDNFLTINYPCHNNIQVLLHSILQLLATPCPALPTTSTNCTSPNMNMAVLDHQHRLLCNSTLDYGFSFSVPQNNVQVGHHLFHPNINNNPNNAQAYNQHPPVFGSQIATYTTPDFNIDHQLSRLASATSPNSNIDATTLNFNIDDHCQRISDPSSPSATFEVWRDLLIDVDPTDSYRKDFMDQTSSHSQR